MISITRRLRHAVRRVDDRHAAAEHRRGMARAGVRVDLEGVELDLERERDRGRLARARRAGCAGLLALEDRQLPLGLLGHEVTSAPERMRRIEWCVIAKPMRQRFRGQRSTSAENDVEREQPLQGEEPGRLVDGLAPPPRPCSDSRIVPAERTTPIRRTRTTVSLREARVERSLRKMPPEARGRAAGCAAMRLEDTGSQPLGGHRCSGIRRGTGTFRKGPGQRGPERDDAERRKGRDRVRRFDRRNGAGLREENVVDVGGPRQARGADAGGGKPREDAPAARGSRETEGGSAVPRPHRSGHDLEDVSPTIEPVQDGPS